MGQFREKTNWNLNSVDASLMAVVALITSGILLAVYLLMVNMTPGTALAQSSESPTVAAVVSM